MFVVFLIIPIRTFAAGGYVASRRSDVYHRIDCYYVDRIAEDNLVFYKTSEDAERSRKRGCMRCSPQYTGSDFRVGKTSRWTNSNPMIQSALEDEYQGGYRDGYEKGKNKGYDEGYESGMTAGAYKERLELYEELEKEKTNSFWGGIIFSFFVLFPILSIVLESLPKKKDKATIMKEELYKKYGAPNSQATQIPNRTTSIAHQTNELDSSAISFIDYRNNVLILIFKSGKEYHYMGIPQHVYNELLDSPSKEKYFHDNIKGKYPTF